MYKFYPIFLKLENRPVLVVGGGRVAERKIDSLLGCGAKVFVVSRGLTAKLKRLVDENRVVFLGREFVPEHVDNKFLVIVGTDDMKLNIRVARIAKQKGAIVNVVDYPSECDFIVPSVMRRGNFVIAVSTSGKSPAFSRVIREELESLYGPEYGVFLDIVGAIRSFLIKMGSPRQKKDKAFENLWNSDMIERIRKNDVEGMARIIAEVSRFF